MALPRELSILIMQGLLVLIENDLGPLDEDDPTKLRLVELRPRSEVFADMVLSCSISTNDPDHPGAWEDEEITKYPPRQGMFSEDYGKNFNELGGGQGFVRRFSIDFKLFYQELGLPREDALGAARVIMARIHRSIVRDREVFTSLARHGDDFGAKLVRWDKAVKKMETIPAGSNSETFVRGKIWLAFEVYHEN